MRARGASPSLIQLKQHGLSRSQGVPGSGKRPQLAGDRRDIANSFGRMAKRRTAERRLLEVFVHDHHPARVVFVREVADDERGARLQPLHQAVFIDAVVALWNLADVIDVVAAKLQEGRCEVEDLPVYVSQVMPHLSFLAKFVERPAEVAEVRRVEDGQRLAAELVEGEPARTI